MKYPMTIDDVRYWLRVCQLLIDLDIGKKDLYYKDRMYLPFLTREMLDEGEDHESLLLKVKMIVVSPEISRTAHSSGFWLDLTEDEALMFKLARP